ncbi:mitochondrial glycoprotein [Mycena olivaceomarginata]|nr:mitochondrial glycoprotein [Mycena olivaceomarginata]
MSSARVFRQLATASGRIASRQLCSSSVSKLPLLARAVPTATRAFSVSARSLKAGASDTLLTQKLAEELLYENEEAAPEEPEFLTSFKEHGTWKIQDTPGSSEVILTRQFGNESIRLTFSIADLQNQEPPEQFEEESDAENPREDELSNDIMSVAVSITKSNAPGALALDLTLQNGQFLIDNVTQYPDAKLGQDVSVETDWNRRGLYVGPEFTTLDVAVQEHFEKFLEERDIGESTAFFIPEYAAHKEQQEYVNWLKNVKGFIDA